MSTLEIISQLVSAICFLVCLGFQLFFRNKTIKCCIRYESFFMKEMPYAKKTEVVGSEMFTFLAKVAPDGSDLANLLDEINHYVKKTRGTTDFSVIQNKVERKLNMRHDLAVAHMAFPTYFGLMGTFLGVFLGIGFFLYAMHQSGGVTDDAIRNLLTGVIVSMTTSLFGLAMTTYNNHKVSNADARIEEDKNEFYDFVQTELMPSLDVSMVAAIKHLHSTVDKFEPAFNRVIKSFQATFDSCTRAFGSTFEQNVRAVAGAVDVMGRNMQKINQNIDLQERLLATFKSGSLVNGMEKYVEAANHFVDITKSLDKFEEARRMMLAAAQETIILQGKVNEELDVPRQLMVEVKQLLNRIKDFEENVNKVGVSLGRRDILGNEVIENIKEQISSIRKKGRIAEKYCETADGKLEDAFKLQTQLIDGLNKRYAEALATHAEGFEEMVRKQTEEMRKRHHEFVEAIEERLDIEDIRKEFLNLRKLDTILKSLEGLAQSTVNGRTLQGELKAMREELDAIKQNGNALLQREEKHGWRLFKR